MVIDDLGHPLERSTPARRVVSLVPSITESLASVDANAIVGATDWCTHPVDLAAQRIRGTKNPDLRAIVGLSPDIVIANQEENRALDVRRLRDAGIAVWVTRIETLDAALDSLHRVFTDALGWSVPSWLPAARTAWSAPPTVSGLRALVPVWRDPWMVVGRQTFTADLLRRLGCDVVPAGGDARYPTVAPGDLDDLGADLVLLPDEPYVFTDADGPEAFVRTPTRLVSGRILTWYGPSLATARPYLESVLARA